MNWYGGGDHNRREWEEEAKRLTPFVVSSPALLLWALLR